MDAEATRKLLHKLKSSLTDLVADNPQLGDDIYLLQWLKVKKMNANHAESSIRSSFCWRKEQDVVAIEKEEFPQDLKSRFPFKFNVRSKNNIPVCYGREDDSGIAGLLKTYGRQTVLRYFIQQAIQVEKQVTEFNRQNCANMQELTPASVTAFKIIFDATGYSLRHVASFKVLQFYHDVTFFNVEHFPFIFNALYCINANKFSRVVIRLTKPLVEFFLDDVRVYGDETTWSEDIFSLIEPEDFRRLQEQKQPEGDTVTAASSMAESFT